MPSVMLRIFALAGILDVHWGRNAGCGAISLLASRSAFSCNCRFANHSLICRQLVAMTTFACFGTTLVAVAVVVAGVAAHSR